jgi:hypothetical protein
MRDCDLSYTKISPKFFIVKVETVLYLQYLNRTWIRHNPRLSLGPQQLSTPIHVSNGREYRLSWTPSVPPSRDHDTVKQQLHTSSDNEYLR